MAGDETSALVGRWRLIHTEGPANFQHVTMEFGADGSLQYSIELMDRIQVVSLTYSVSGNVIISNQPSAPGEERTRFSIGADGRLELHHGDSRLWFERVPSA
jgi:hypothetical protein